MAGKAQLPNARPAKDSSEETVTRKFPEVSLAEMGFSADDPNWVNFKEIPKPKPTKFLQSIIRGHHHTNVKIGIDMRTYYCHYIVLQCYSEYFNERKNEGSMQLPADKVTANAFECIYKWMIEDIYEFQSEDLVEVFVAAKYLDISKLIEECYEIISQEYYREENAAALYYEAEKYGLKEIQDLMLPRISKCFLNMIACDAFTSLSAKQAVNLLSSNSIAINSEIEVFMSAVRWLNFNWIEREQHTLELLTAVRFQIMPIIFIVKIIKETECLEIKRIKANRKVIELLHEFIMQQIKQDNGLEPPCNLKNYHREWIFDKNCLYHHCAKCSNIHEVTYDGFLQYLNYINDKGMLYYKTFETAIDQTCCSNSDKRENGTPK